MVIRPGYMIDAPDVFAMERLRRVRRVLLRSVDTNDRFLDLWNFGSGSGAISMPELDDGSKST